MQLSVIIVNYNVRYFLEQALYAVRKAAEGMAVEVYVVDNNSVDSSCDMVREKFPEVVLIANQDNPGFSKANNQAIRISTGKYVLLLNPDTVVQEDTFQKTVAFMDAHPEAGGLGIRMIDGSGRFLPESKRGFPSPMVAFYKAFGLAALFPKSKTFNKYSLGYLSEHENHEVDVLAGAFMLMRRTALDKAGLLDEAFFMYGEDIDLSYRLVLAGYKNYYFAESTIIHYKGESTKKGSLNYVKTFYEAMIIFAKKHFTGNSMRLFVAFLEFAIYFRAALALFSTLVERLFMPFLDATTLFLGMYALQSFWGIKVFQNANYYGDTFLYFNMPLYVAFWISGIWLVGGYDKRFALTPILRGLFFGFLAISAVYGFLDMAYRSSRSLIVIGTIYAIFVLPLLRYLLHFIQYKNLNIAGDTTKNLVIVADTTESNRVKTLLNDAQVRFNLIGTVAPSENLQNSDYIGNITQVEDIIRIYKINEIIFCSKNIASETIMQIMARCGTAIEYKIVPLESWSIIGSSNKDTAGELYTIDIRYNIADPQQQRSKRLFDIAVSIFLLLTLPALGRLLHKNQNTFAKIWSVLIGKKTLVGYADAPLHQHNLPRLAPALLTCADAHPHIAISQTTKAHLNFLYAKDYTTAKDWEIFWAAWRLM
jgi:GT2 family glycosyltransferase